MSEWITAWKHEQQRQAAQRAASADRRAAAIEAGKQNVGTYAAVAEALGISAAAVSDARGNARDRERIPPMADYLELDLPRAGDAVPLPAEWDAVPEPQRPAVAARAAATWNAIASATRHLASQAHDASEALAEALVLGIDDDGIDAVREHVAQTAPGWPVPADSAEQEQLIRVLADLAAGLRDRCRTATKEADRWRQLAGDDFAGEAAAL